MDNKALAKQALACLEESSAAERDYRSLFELLADDSLFRIAWRREGTPLSGEFRGKRAVEDYFTVTSPMVFEDQWLEKPLEYAGHGDQIVVVGAEGYTIRKTGVTVRQRDFALIIDFRDGMISRMKQLRDLSEYMDAFRLD